MLKVDSIIFDLDGTLWDSLETCLKAWEKALNDFVYIKEPITAEDLRGVFGLQHDLIGEKLFPYLSKEQREEVIELCYKEEIKLIAKQGGALYEDLEETLNKLKSEYKLFIVSNCQAGYIEAFLEYHNLKDLFLDFECSGATGKSKAENIKLVIQRNSLNNPVYVGDILGDYKAAEKNKIPFIYAEYGFGNIEKVEYRIESLKRLQNLKEVLIGHN